MRVLQCAVIATLALTEPSRAIAQNALGGMLTPGSYAVGFRTLFVRDTTHRWLSPGAGTTTLDPGRPIRISFWYPASVTAQTPTMRYGDYFHYDGPPAFRTLDDTLEQSDRQGWIADLTELAPAGRDLAARLFATPVAAHRDAPAASGHFPMLLYAAGKGSRSDANVELGEYLASHGYVVATIPQLGPSAANLDLGSSPSDIQLHVQDLEFAWRTLRSLPIVDSARLAIAGHSAGGIAALQFAMLNPGVKALIGLDGSYGMWGEGARAALHRTKANDFPDYAPGRITAPLLDLRRANGVQGAILDSSVVAALRSSDRYVVTFPRMYHGDFTEWAPVAVTLGVPWETTTDARTRQTGYEGNQHAYRAILAFLEATVGNVAGGLDAMTAELRQVAGVTIVHERPTRNFR